jgi:HEAT repeat protein
MAHSKDDQAFRAEDEMKTSVLSFIVLILFTGCARKPTAELVDQLKDRESVQRLRAIKELENRSQDAGVVVPALVECLHDADPFVRRDAATALGQFGPDGKTATSALLVALRDKTPKVRTAAAEALKKVDPESAAQAGVR